MQIKLERTQNDLEEMEDELIKAETEIRDLKMKSSYSKPEVSVLNSITEMETRVRKQSLLETSGKINGLEEALKYHESSNKEMENKLDFYEKEALRLSKENKQLQQELYTANENNERIQKDIEQFNKMKVAFEVEFTEVVDAKDKEIGQLEKHISSIKEEYKSILRKNMEIEAKLSKFRLKSNQSSPGNKHEIQGERIDTSATNEEDELKFGWEGDAEPEGMIIFDGEINENVNYRLSDTYENLGDLMWSRNSYYGRDAEKFLSNGETVEIIENVEDDFERLVDIGTQTITGYSTQLQLDLKPIEEEKYSTSLQNYSMELKSDLNLNESTLSTSRGPSPRKDALEEYFKMAVLANKIAHQDLDKVCHIKSNILYEKVRYQQIPFQDWQSWIEKQLNQLYLDTMYEYKNENNSRLSSCENSDLFEENIGMDFQKRNTESKKGQLRKFFTEKSKKVDRYHKFSDEEVEPQKHKCIIF